MDRSTAALPLSQATLALLPADVQVPEYDRSALVPSVVHLGVGGFHRAHQAVYLDDLARLGETAWGEVGVGLRSPAMRDALVPQDCLWTVLERSPDGDRARVVGAMTRYLFAPDDPAAVTAVLADPRTRLVTLTITGGGYLVDGAGAFAPDEEALADLERLTAPRTAFGHLLAAVDRRRRAGLPGVTVLSCDNLADNGPATRTSLVALAALLDPDLAAWVDREVCFPSSLVDRITPLTDDTARGLVAAAGVSDRWPVVTEPFSQWVVEDDFCGERPPLELVGVRFVADVRPHRLVKTRLLNGAHTALGHLGRLSGGAGTASEALDNPVLADYLAALMRDEIAPLLPPVAGEDVEDYVRSLLTRFANPQISDQLARLAARGSTKVPAYVLPSLAQARREGRPSRLLTLALAAWLASLRGVDLDGAPLDVEDALLAELQPLADALPDPRPLLGRRDLFGDLGDDDALVGALRAAVEDLYAYGAVAAACARLVVEPGPVEPRFGGLGVVDLRVADLHVAGLVPVA